VAGQTLFLDYLIKKKKLPTLFYTVFSTPRPPRDSAGTTADFFADHRATTSRLRRNHRRFFRRPPRDHRATPAGFFVKKFSFFRQKIFCSSVQIKTDSTLQ
jgi:hypothetical protein